MPAVEVRLLGQVEVIAPGLVDPALRPLLTEVVVAAALHREGLHEAVLRAEVWPHGVSDDVLAAVGTAVARRAAGLAAGSGDRTAAERNLRAGLALVPTAEALWRNLLRLVADDPSQAAAVAEQMYDELGHRGLSAEAETDALIEQVVPGFVASA